MLSLNEAHLFRLSQEYIGYYHQVRTHIALDKHTPGVREVEPRPLPLRRGVAVPRIGGLHHRDVWPAA